MSATRKTERFDKLFSGRDQTSPDKAAVLDNLMGTENEHKTEQVGEQVTEHISEQSNEHITSHVTEHMTDTVTEPVNENKPEHEEEVETEHNQEDILKTFKKQKVEDTYTRATYLIRNDLLKQLDKLSKGQGKGFKTKVINHALEQFLKSLR